jgi:hypothetical protein
LDFIPVFRIYKSAVIENDKGWVIYLKQSHAFETAKSNPEKSIKTGHIVKSWTKHAAGYGSTIGFSQTIGIVFYIAVGCPSQLRRTRSGDFSVTQALPLDTLLQEPTLLKQYLITAEGTDRQ